MSDYYEGPARKFYRDRERGKIAGVCAGLADYFGFDLTMTRLLTVVALLLAGPITIVMYIVLVLLVPAGPTSAGNDRRDTDRGFRRALRKSPRTTMTDVRRSLLRLDTRLARLERYVTSPRFDLDRKINEL
ncbi:MAG: envelope stress response membrane protein PspC [Pseudomonadota bacterium]